MDFGTRIMEHEAKTMKGESRNRSRRRLLPVPCSPFHEGGFTLIELIVAFGILTMAFSAMAAFMGGTTRSVVAARQDLIAANLAQEGVELVRNLRDENWIVGVVADHDGTCTTAPGTWREVVCNGTYRVAIADNIIDSPTFTSDATPTETLFRQTNGTYTYSSSPTPTSFNRAVTLAAGPSDPVTAMLVTVTLTWCPNGQLSCPGRSRSLTVVDELRNWGGGNFP